MLAVPLICLQAWAIVEPLIPPARHGGRKRSVNVRDKKDATNWEDHLKNSLPELSAFAD